jgi:chromosome segregation ATPase
LTPALPSLKFSVPEVAMKSLLEKLQEKELQIEALRAQIAKLEKDIETLQSAARILNDDEDSNPLADLVAPELSAKAVAITEGHGQKPSNGFDMQANKKKAWP